MLLINVFCSLKISYMHAMYFNYIHSLPYLLPDPILPTCPNPLHFFPRNCNNPLSTICDDHPVVHLPSVNLSTYQGLHAPLKTTGSPNPFASIWGGVLWAPPHSTGMLTDLILVRQLQLLWTQEYIGPVKSTNRLLCLVLSNLWLLTFPLFSQCSPSFHLLNTASSQKGPESYKTTQ